MMKHFNNFLSLVTISMLFIACEPAIKVDITEKESENPSEMSYDSALAQKLGADEYGMKKYVMAFLKTGPYEEKDSVKRAELHRGHLDNIFRLADEGKLALAGPFMDDSDMRGVFIFNVSTVDEAKALTESDPAINAGLFVIEYHPWYGSAAACMINDQHKRIAKNPI